MQLDIIEVLSEIGRQMPYDIKEPPLVDEDVECTRPITGQIVFNNTGGILLVSGAAQTAVALACSRCAEYFERPVALKIDEQFELKQRAAGPRTLQTVAEVIEEDESPVAEKLFAGSMFNLTEMLRQYILLDQPTKPLPAVTAEERCTHCHRTPAEVLGASFPAAISEPINPAFAKLGEMLEKPHPDSR